MMMSKKLEGGWGGRAQRLTPMAFSGNEKRETRWTKESQTDKHIDGLDD